MDLKPRFNNKVIRQLFDSSGIDLMAMKGDIITNADARTVITIAGMPEADPAQVEAACDELTPGEHIELLTEAIRRDLVPASLREAGAKAATPDKSAGA